MGSVELCMQWMKTRCTSVDSPTMVLVLVSIRIPKYATEYVKSEWILSGGLNTFIIPIPYWGAKFILRYKLGNY